VTQRFRACVHHPARVFMPVQAILGYPNRCAKEPAVAEHRQKFVDFSRKLHAVLAPLLGGVLLLARRADRAYVKRVRGPNDQGRLRCLDRLWCVCHYTCPMVGARVVGLGCRQIARRDETGRSQTHPCPLTYAAPAVHFQSLLLAEFRCPIENDRDYRQ
jgi:hypothetical protein